MHNVHRDHWEHSVILDNVIPKIADRMNLFDYKYMFQNGNVP